MYLEVVIMLTTPSGTPALPASSASASCFSRSAQDGSIGVSLTAENGVSAAGLMTTVHPAARAGPNFLVIIALGKFHGLLLLGISTILMQEKSSHVAMNTGPIACLMTTPRRWGIEVGITSPYVLRDSSAEGALLNTGRGSVI